MINKNLSKIVCIDVSKFLEKGYQTENTSLRSKYRLFYKQFAVQCLKIIYEFLGKESIVIMDEIEFIPDMKKIIKLYNSKGIGFNIAIHNLDSLNTSKDLFSKISIGEKYI